MSRFGKWWNQGKALTSSSSSQSLDSLAESQSLEGALRAVEKIMNDDIEGAEAGLADGNSAFHKLARGTLGFMKATLGFEQDVMKDASEALYEAEQTASASYYKAQHDSKVFTSRIYDKGSEFALCQAEAQVMAAVVGVLNESLTESIKGFYKLRKAYATLDSLVQMEMKYMKGPGMRSQTVSKQPSLESIASGGSLEVIDEKVPTIQVGVHQGSQEAHANRPSALRNSQIIDSDSDGSNDKFYEAENGKHTTTDGYAGKLDIPNQSHALDKKMEALEVSDNRTTTRPTVSRTSTMASGMSSRPALSRTVSTASAIGLLDIDADSEVFANSLDVFIHTGTNLMAGMLNLMISVIPPAFGKLLFIIGFRGDRDKGLRMLWQAAKFSNINGGMAGLVVFGWYNGLIGFCDIITDSDPEDPTATAGYPAVRLELLLADMRGRYPESYLWLVEEARMAGHRRNLDSAIEILSRPGKSSIRQLEALHVFEKSLALMFTHRYELCAEAFIECVDLNGWSQSLYYYIAGACHVQAYRETTDAAARKKHEKLAKEYFQTAPTKVGKKKMMGRQLPFDTFVIRKLAKWEERATKWNCSLIDAIGVSPVEEMIFLWNGYKKMNTKELEDSLQILAQSEAQPRWKEEEADEQAILALLRGVILRHMRRHAESIEILENKITSLEPGALRGLNKDDWPAPVAHYEMAANYWMQRSGYIRQYGSTIMRDPFKHGDHDLPLDLNKDISLVVQAKAHAEKAKNWEKYELDARFGMKVTASLKAIETWERKNLTHR